MTIEASEAAALIDDIELVRRHVRQSTFYRVAADVVIGWGALAVVGNLANWAQPRAGGWIWLAINLLGVAGTIVFALGLRRRGLSFDWRIMAALALFFAFGFLWSSVFGRFGPRELCAFWPSLFMFGYAIAGLWLGRAFIALGLAVTALIVAGYLFAGAWFNLYLAIVDGGGLILCGLWMRRA